MKAKKVNLKSQEFSSKDLRDKFYLLIKKVQSGKISKYPSDLVMGVIFLKEMGSSKYEISKTLNINYTLIRNWCL